VHEAYSLVTGQARFPLDTDGSTSLAARRIDVGAATFGGKASTTPARREAVAHAAGAGANPRAWCLEWHTLLLS
jgi:hypothetical protein